MTSSSSKVATRPSMAWVCCMGSAPAAWDENGTRVRYDEAVYEPLLQPPSHIRFGGVDGELLDVATFEERLGFTLTASIEAAAPELIRNLPLDNLPADALPPELMPDPLLCEALAHAVRSGSAANVFVAPDAYGGHGLFAAANLEPASLVGEYVGTLCRGTAAAATDPFIMSYPGAAGALYLTAKDAGSLARFINHAPRGSATNNATCWAVLVDGAYHVCVVTTTTIQAGDEIFYDYGKDYWARRSPALTVGCDGPRDLHDPVQ